MAAASLELPGPSRVITWNPSPHTLVTVYEPNPGWVPILGTRDRLLWKLEIGPETATGYHEGWWDPAIGSAGGTYHPPGEGYSPIVGEPIEEFSILEKSQEYLGYAAIGLTAFDIVSTFIEDSQTGHGYGRTIREAEAQGAGWAGAYVGAQVGAAYGASVGLDFGPQGAALGAALGGLVGSVVGFSYGAQVVEDWGNPNASHGYSGTPPCGGLFGINYAIGWTPPGCGESSEM